MAGFEFTGDNPLRYADRETGAKLEVRSIIDSETGKKICILFADDIMNVVQIHNASLKTALWKQALKTSGEVLPVEFAKVCPAAEKTRIKSVTNVESTAETI